MLTESQIAPLLSIGEPRGPGPDTRLSGLVALARQMGPVPPDRDTPVREVVARLGDNWSPLILQILATGSYRHATLKRLIAAFASEEEISQRMLTLRLRALERDGFVARHVQDEVKPPRVSYALTPLGRELQQELTRLLSWIEQASPRIEAARQGFAGDRSPR
ncbi:transcriptional regulator [Pseudooceanicola sp. GBMRC 2024]|uniref:Transcriptional regulator n=1 Tax=Pseudooceanicola albus TaxID=2692189 RepID=A0A6L7GAB1_9RHOB|nr:MULTISPECIES: helix-turn-helix domain-containing protein [Pseudooceanicola]MXN20961.1 transcriptional regulator [Pseudooceanicola albus]